MQLRSDGFWRKGILGRTRRSHYRAENISVNKKTKEVGSGVTYEAGISCSEGCKGLSNPHREGAGL